MADTHLPKRAKELPERLLAELPRADVVFHAGDWVDTATLDLLESRGRRAAHGRGTAPPATSVTDGFGAATRGTRHHCPARRQGHCQTPLLRLDHGWHTGNASPTRGQPGPARGLAAHRPPRHVRRVLPGAARR